MGGGATAYYVGPTEKIWAELRAALKLMLQHIGR